MHLGARRGINVGCVGAAGCGKSTLLEPLEFVFNTLGKPQKGSSFPLGNLPGRDIALWQDYEHDEKTLRISDLCGLLCGESIGVRIPGKVNRKHRNKAPLFYTGRAEISCRRVDKKEETMYNGMIQERFRVFHFTVPFPKAERKLDFPQCGKCCAAMFAAHADAVGSDGDAPSEGALPGAPGAMTAQEVIRALKDAAALHKDGVLDDAEFSALKAKLLK